MKSRIPPELRLAPSTNAVIRELADKWAHEKLEELQAKRDEDTIRRVLKSFTVRNNDLYGIGAERAVKLLKAVETDMTTEDPEEVWRHIDARLEQMGLDFYEKEAY